MLRFFSIPRSPIPVPAMSRVCPNCRHLRPADTIAPEWQCPACGKAYNKGEGAPVDASYGRSGDVAPAGRPASRRSPLLRLLLVGALLGGALHYWPEGGLDAFRSAKVQAAPREQPKVIMYATQWCGYCAAAREFFAANGVRYDERDIEQSSVYADEHRRLGGSGLPLILVGDDRINGYNEGTLRSLLRHWLKG